MRTFALRRSCWVRGNHLTIDGGGCKEGPISPSSCVDPTDPSHGWPTSSFAHPIPRVILALGIKAIADSSIAASCKKFANQLDTQFTGHRCTVLVSFRCLEENLGHP
ncbi:hypothetical protein QLX08_002756 [Tetragonisca angustula]|uniref:Uncharacterized protein n=1 Tax=Tetragonisca angustula TaxID=166442 RepID=A0AAW1A9X0_9HYME